MDYQSKAAEALRLAQTRQYQRAIPALRRLLHETYVTDFEYDDWLRALADAQKAIQLPLPAGYIYLYLHYFDMALECFELAKSPLDLALCYESQGRYREASKIFLRERKLARAAANLEHLGSFREALPLWERLEQEVTPLDDRYALALVKLNWVHCARKVKVEEDQIRRTLVEALVLLEGLADEREQQGMLDEALDCYHLMIQIGLEQRAFENLSEGFINAIRILTERGRLLTALRYYAGIGETGALWGEHHAVATLFRDAAEAVQRAGMLYSGHFLKQAADSWVKVARHNLELGAPPELTENALLAALDCFNQLDDGANVTKSYEMLGALALASEKQQRYRKLAGQSAKEQRSPVQIFPPSQILRRPPRLPTLWREDLLEWESGDDSISVLTQVIWDLNYHDTVRRKALNLVLYFLDIRDRDPAQDKNLSLEVARTLAHMKPKVAFRGLKKLSASSDPEVRAEAMKAAGIAANATSLVLLEQGLADSDPDVREAALRGIERHGYPEAFDALKRILEAHRETEILRVVVETMGKIRTFEAAEYLYRMLAAGPPAGLQGVLKKSFQSQLNAETQRIFKNRVANESEKVQQRLAFLLARP